MVGSIGVTYRSKIAKIIPIGNPRWPPGQPSWKSIFCFFSWTERSIDSKLARKHRDDLFKQSSWILHKMFVLMISMSSSKLGHLGSKTRSPGQISGKTCNHSSGHIFQAIIMNLAQNVCLDGYLGQVQNWVTWGQKLGHLAKSAKTFVNTLAVTFLKQSSWILLKMFCLNEFYLFFYLNNV